MPDYLHVRVLEEPNGKDWIKSEVTDAQIYLCVAQSILRRYNVKSHWKVQGWIELGITEVKGHTYVIKCIETMK